MTDPSNKLHGSRFVVIVRGSPRLPRQLSVTDPIQNARELLMLDSRTQDFHASVGEIRAEPDL
jgi:hypothetical protein